MASVDENLEVFKQLKIEMQNEKKAKENAQRKDAESKKKDDTEKNKIKTIM